MTGNSLLIRIKITIQFKNDPKKIGIRTASLHETINLFIKLTIARRSCFAPEKAVVTQALLRHVTRHSFMIAVTVRVNNHCPALLNLVAIYSWLPNNCLCIERYSSQHMQQCEKNVFNIFKISKINLEYFAIFLT